MGTFDPKLATQAQGVQPVNNVADSTAPLEAAKSLIAMGKEYKKGANEQEFSNHLTKLKEAVDQGLPVQQANIKAKAKLQEAITQSPWMADEYRKEYNNFFSGGGGGGFKDPQEELWKATLAQAKTFGVSMYKADGATPKTKQEIAREVFERSQLKAHQVEVQMKLQDINLTSKEKESELKKVTPKIVSKAVEISQSRVQDLYSAYKAGKLTATELQYRLSQEKLSAINELRETFSKNLPGIDPTKLEQSFKPIEDVFDSISKEMIEGSLDANAAKNRLTAFKVATEEKLYEDNPDLARTSILVKSIGNSLGYFPVKDQAEIAKVYVDALKGYNKPNGVDNTKIDTRVLSGEAPKDKPFIASFINTAQDGHNPDGSELTGKDYVKVTSYLLSPEVKKEVASDPVLSSKYAELLNKLNENYLTKGMKQVRESFSTLPWYNGGGKEDLNQRLLEQRLKMVVTPKGGVYFGANTEGLTPSDARQARELVTKYNNSIAKGLTNLARMAMDQGENVDNIRKAFEYSLYNTAGAGQTGFLEPKTVEDQYAEEEANKKQLEAKAEMYRKKYGKASSVKLLESLIEKLRSQAEDVLLPSGKEIAKTKEINDD